MTRIFNSSLGRESHTLIGAGLDKIDAGRCVGRACGAGDARRYGAFEQSRKTAEAPARVDSWRRRSLEHDAAKENEASKGRKPAKLQRPSTTATLLPSDPRHFRYGRLRARADDIFVEKIRARVEDRPLMLDESHPSIVVFKSPPFKASARISFPGLEVSESWTVGWIQACCSMKFRITYGTQGFSSWEFPQLKTQPMISDSDGRNFPWYGGNKEIDTIKGPSVRRSVEVKMTDSFAPRVTWLPPFYPQSVHESRSAEAELTRILRDQSFFTWLVAKNESSAEIVVLATIRWRAYIDVAFDPKAPIGRRGTVIGDGFPKFQPEILSYNEPIPQCALSPPHANEAQMLVWRKHGFEGETVVVPPFLNKTHDEMETRHRRS